MKKLFCVVAVGLLFSCHSVNQRFTMEDDNILEESVEALIEYYVDAFLPIHLELDMTPGSPELSETNNKEENKP